MAQLLEVGGELVFGGHRRSFCGLGSLANRQIDNMALSWRSSAMIQLTDSSAISNIYNFNPKLFESTGR
jgi:hypothetical protein